MKKNVYEIASLSNGCRVWFFNNSGVVMYGEIIQIHWVCDHKLPPLIYYTILEKEQKGRFHIQDKDVFETEDEAHKKAASIKEKMKEHVI